ncbi:MAG: NYN domain-containing protein [Acidimicrobiia bacterium]
MRFKLTSVLGKALDSARAALADLDADQVPAKLRQVVGHAGDFTPDLARRLTRELDRIDWLRTRALEQWPDADPVKPGPHRASALFLVRPEGWAADLVGVVGEAVASAVGEGREPSDGGRDELVKDRDAWKAKARDLQKKLETATTERAKAEKAVRAPDRATKAAGAKETAARRRAETDHAAEVEQLQRLITDLENKVKNAGEEVRRLRRSAGDSEARAVEAETGPGWLGTDPIDLARHLDDLMARSRRVGATDPGPLPAEERLQLPVGVGPDSPEAIDAVARMGGRVAVIVDGYNAGLALGPGTAAEVRSRLEPHLRRLRSLGGPAMTVTVVWDSKAEQQGSRKPGGGIEVVFAPAGIEADDVVVDIAARRSRCVVITNDRAVRERAERTGALALWSDALVAWARKRG